MIKSWTFPHEKTVVFINPELLCVLCVNHTSGSLSVCGPFGADRSVRTVLLAKEREPDSTKTTPFAVRRQRISSLIHTSPSAAFVFSFHVFLGHPWKSEASWLLVFPAVCFGNSEVFEADTNGGFKRRAFLKWGVLRCEGRLCNVHVAAHSPLFCSSTWDESRTAGQAAHSFWACHGLH